ncbi:uracil DNA glycosylase [Actinomortierella wolfii]|nr:uracil DNA glycosylase [Actinomortierella wolfii]
MSSSLKRAADGAQRADAAKKAASSPRPMAQSSLLSFMKKTPSTTASDEKSDENATTKTESSSSSSPSKTATTTALSPAAAALAASAAKIDILKNLKPEQQELLRLEQNTMDGTWLKALQAEFTKPYFLELKKFLKAQNEAGKNIFPPKHEIYSWSRFTPLNKVRVVILDPYHGPGQAHGLCFSVKKPVPPPPSLKNIYKCLQQDIPGFVVPNHGYLESWARQGVLMVNAAMTVEQSKANSHADRGWEKLLDVIIKTINDQRKNVVFLLWGSPAQRRGKKVDRTKHLVLESVHPSPLSAHKGFFECKHFSKTNEYLASKGLPVIDWNTLKDDN